MMIPASKDKWQKYNCLKEALNLTPYLPETRLMSKSSFWNLMGKYGRVIVKPTGGSRGRSVFLVTSKGNDQYEVHIEKRKTILSGKECIYDFLNKEIGSQSFIVQRCIDRATVQGNPFDVRVIVQRKRNSDLWVVTGKVAKVAGTGYIVSNNTRSKGQLLFVQTALIRSSIKGLPQQTILTALDQVALQSARRLTELFPGHRMYGFDMALDQNGKVWIIEANLFPSRSHFRKLKDQRMFRLITSYK